MGNNLQLSGMIITLLLINARYYINKQIRARRYCLTHIQLMELQLKNTAYLIINMICVCMVCLF